MGQSICVSPFGHGLVLKLPKLNSSKKDRLLYVFGNLGYEEGLKTLPIHWKLDTRNLYSCFSAKFLTTLKKNRVNLIHEYNTKEQIGHHILTLTHPWDFRVWKKPFQISHKLFFLWLNCFTLYKYTHLFSFFSFFLYFMYGFFYIEYE